jgi:hydrogenase nickel incorporation protein HypB
MKIVAASKILKANEALAEENRAALGAAGVYCVNLVGSPGCGKTTFIEAILGHLTGRLSVAVIEGDIAGSIDAERIDALGVPVVQINTGGACHLDANMIVAAERDIDLEAIDLLFIENVGNLVCTAGFDLGEHLRIVALSTAEGDDKIAKYPAIFQRSHALVITKMDLLPHTDFDIERVTADMKRLAGDAEVLKVSAVTGQGILAAADWLAQRRESAVASRRLSGGS